MAIHGPRCVSCFNAVRDVLIVVAGFITEPIAAAIPPKKRELSRARPVAVWRAPATEDSSGVAPCASMPSCAQVIARGDSAGNYGLALVSPAPAFRAAMLTPRPMFSRRSRKVSDIALAETDWVFAPSGRAC